MRNRTGDTDNHPNVDVHVCLSVSPHIHGVPVCVFEDPGRVVDFYILFDGLKNFI